MCRLLESIIRQYQTGNGQESYGEELEAKVDSDKEIEIEDFQSTEDLSQRMYTVI